MNEKISTKRAALEAAKAALEKTRSALSARDKAARSLDEQAEDARMKLAAAEKDLRAAEDEELRRELTAAEQNAAVALDALLGKLDAVGDAVVIARRAAAAVNAILPKLGSAVTKVDQVENAVMAALVRFGVIDSRSLGISASVLSRLDPAADRERQRRDAQLEEEKRAEAERHQNDPARIAREAAGWHRKIETLRRQRQGPEIRKRLAEAEHTLAELSDFEHVTGEALELLAA